jgi:hypothetical protein
MLNSSEIAIKTAINPENFISFEAPKWLCGRNAFRHRMEAAWFQFPTIHPID